MYLEAKYNFLQVKIEVAFCLLKQKLLYVEHNIHENIQYCHVLNCLGYREDKPFSKSIEPNYLVCRI